MSTALAPFLKYIIPFYNLNDEDAVIYDRIQSYAISIMIVFDFFALLIFGLTFMVAYKFWKKSASTGLFRISNNFEFSIIFLSCNLLNIAAFTHALTNQSFGETSFDRPEIIVDACITFLLPVLCSLIVWIGLAKISQTMWGE